MSLDGRDCLHKLLVAAARRAGAVQVHHDGRFDAANAGERAYTASPDHDPGVVQAGRSAP